jgi:hypothetical protein
MARDTGNMTYARDFLADWREMDNGAVRTALKKLNVSKAISAMPRSRFLRQERLSADAEAAVEKETIRQVDVIYANARLSAAAYAEDLDHLGLLSSASKGGRRGLIRWAAFRGLVDALDGVAAATPGHDTEPYHAMKANLDFCAFVRSQRDYAGIVAYGAFRDAGLGVDSYLEASEFGAGALLAETLVRHAFHLLSLPHGPRSDNEQLLAIVRQLGAKVIAAGAREDLEALTGERLALEDGTGGPKM